MTRFASAPFGGPTPRGRRLVVSVLGTVLLVIGSALSVAAVGPQFTAWGAGVAVDAVNLPAPSHDGCPIESPNGTQLYLASNRAGTLGMNDIWVAERASKDAPWGAVEHLSAPVNSQFNDFCPTPLDGGWLLFVSTRPAQNCAGASPNGDIYLTRQRDDGTWADPQHLGCYPDGPNFVGGEFGPSLVRMRGETLLYYSSNGADPVNDPDQDIYVSRRNADGSFGPGTPVAELNTAAEETMPNVSRLHTEMVFASNRSGGAGATDIYTATFDRDTGLWSNVANVVSVNTAAPESRPSLSGDGLRLYFGRGAVPGDIYVSTRLKVDDD